MMRFIGPLSILIFIITVSFLAKRGQFKWKVDSISTLNRLPKTKYFYSLLTIVLFYIGICYSLWINSVLPVSNGMSPIFSTLALITATIALPLDPFKMPHYILMGLCFLLIGLGLGTVGTQLISSNYIYLGYSIIGTALSFPLIVVTVLTKKVGVMFGEYIMLGVLFIDFLLISLFI